MTDCRDDETRYKLHENSNRGANSGDTDPENSAPILAENIPVRKYNPDVTLPLDAAFSMTKRRE